MPPLDPVSLFLKLKLRITGMLNMTKILMMKKGHYYLYAEIQRFQACK